MTLTIELSPQEQRRVLAARGQGVDIHALIHGLLAQLPEIETAAQEATLPENAALKSAFADAPRPTPDELETFLAEFAAVGQGKGYLRPEAFDRETLYEERL